MVVQPGLRDIQAVAVVLDFDGVVADTEGLQLEAWEWVARERSGPHAPPSLKHTPGLPDMEIAKLLCDADGPSCIQLVEQKRARYRRLAADAGARAIPGVEAFVRWARDEYRLAVASSTDSAEVRNQLRILGLEQHFQAIVGGEMRRLKPAPDIYGAACRALDAAPAQCIALEDSPAGLQAAKRAGLTAVAIATSFDEKQLWDHADVVIQSFDDFRRRLSRDGAEDRRSRPA